MKKLANKIINASKRTLALVIMLCIMASVLPSYALAGDVEPPPNFDDWLEGDFPAKSDELTSMVLGAQYGHVGKFLAAIEPPDTSAIQIYNAQDLWDIRNNPGGSYVLMNDITDMHTVNDGQWLPIGDYAVPFTGTLDGQGHIVHNLTITGTIQSDKENYYCGLFGVIQNARIMNLGLEETEIDIVNTTQNSGFHLSVSAGGICGIAMESVCIENCYNTGSISSNRAFSLGGICGGVMPLSIKTISDSVLINNCYNACSISTESSAYAGGICGIISIGADYATGSVNIYNCYNIGDVSAFEYAGGICSEIRAIISGSIMIGNCYNAGSVSSYHPGGVCANAIGDIDDAFNTIMISKCYNTGLISIIGGESTHATAGGVCASAVGVVTVVDCYNEGYVYAPPFTSDSCLGGIIGRSTDITSIENCYNRGILSGNSQTQPNSSYEGGIVGIYYISTTTDVISNCYWDISRSQKGIGRGMDNTTPLTTEKMSDRTNYSTHYSGFDFSNTWGFKDGVNDGYPILRSFYAAVSSVSLHPTTLSMDIGDTYQLGCTVLPNDDIFPLVRWSSSDDTVATVENGLVTALSTGTATITVTTEDGGYEATCEVTVAPVDIKVTLNPSSITLAVGDTESLLVSFDPSDATYNELVWSNSNSSIASVDNGDVTAKSVGMVDITVTVSTDDGDFTATCKVTVTAVALNKVAYPLANPSPGTVMSGEFVELTCRTTDAIIRYTTDGSEPSENSIIYSSPIQISAFTVINAKAFKSGMDASDMTSYTYDIMPTVSAPTADVASGNVAERTRVTLTTETGGATIRYTTDGTEPNESSPIYSTTITITDSPTIIKAKAFKNKMVASGTATYTYYLKASEPIILPNTNVGAIVSGSFVTLNCATFGATIHYTTNGTEPTESSNIYSSPLPLTTSTTIKAKAFKGTWIASDTKTAAYTVKAATPTAAPVPGSVSSGTTVALSCATPGVTIRYTTNGTEPVSSSTAYSPSSPITINSITTIKAKAFDNSGSIIASDTATFVYDVKVLAPTSSHRSGTVIANDERITLSSETPNARIYYTTNGSEPTESSSHYTAPFAISASATIKAKAFMDGMSPSEAVTFAYTVAQRVSAPTANRVSGSTIPGGEKVALHHQDSGVTIRYTDNGSEPDENSRIYSSPIMVVSGKQGTIMFGNPTMIIKAKAFKNGMAASSTAEFTYNVGNPLPMSVDLDKISVKLPNDVPFIGGHTLELNIEGLPASVIFDDNRFMVAIGKSTPITKNEWVPYKSDALTPGGSTTAGENVSKPLLGDKIEASWRVSGYAEGVIAQDYSLSSLSGGIMLSVNVKSEFAWQTFIWVIPVVLEMDIKGSLSFNGGIGFDTLNLDGSPQFVVNANVNAVFPEIELRCGIGLAKVASLGIYGKASLCFNWNIVNQYIRLWMNGEAGGYAKVLWFKHTISFISGTWNIGEWYHGIASQSMALSPLSTDVFIQGNMYNSDKYELAPRNYLGAQSPWLGNQVSRTRSVNPISTLQSSVYDQTAPMIAEANGQRVMVFLSDDGSRDDMNRTKLMYSVYDSGLNTWSVPQAVYDDGTADFYPSITDDGNSIWVTWHKSNRVFTDADDMPDIVAASEIAVARFDAMTGQFTNVEILTSNDVLDTQPSIAVNGSNVIAAWVRNADNDIFGTGGYSNKIMARRYYNGVWEPEIELKSGLGTVIDIDAGYYGSDFRIAYITDNDNDFDTIDDRNLIIIDLSGTVTNSPVSNSLVSTPCFTSVNGTKMLCWYENGNIRYINADGHLVTLFDEPDMPTDNFKVLSNGANMAVVYPTFEDDTGYFTARLYNAGQWGAPFRLAETGGYAQYYDGFLENSGEFSLVFNNSYMDIVGEGDDALLVENNNLCSLNASPPTNIGLAGLYYANDDVVLGQTLPVSIDVANIGGVTVSNVNVKAESNNTTVFGGTFPITGGLLTGETETIVFYLPIPTGMSPQTEFTISIEPVGQVDSDMSDNSVTITLGYTNLSLMLEKQYNEDATVTIAVAVENDSDYEANAKLLVHQGSLDGEVIDFVELGAIDVRDGIITEFTYDPNTLVPYGEDYEVLYYELLSDREEVYSSSKSDFAVIYALNTYEPDVEVINAQQPVITAQPQDGTVSMGASGANHDLSVTASVTDGGTVSYQWYSNGSASNSGGTVVSGATCATYSVPVDTVGTYYYYVVVTNTIPDNGDGGRKTASATSNVATVTVSGSSGPGGDNIYNPPQQSYAATVDPSSKTFTTARPGYSNSGMTQVFTIRNTGTNQISNLSASFMTAQLIGTGFEIVSDLSVRSIAPGGTATISVRPVGGLALGSYIDVLRIAGSNGIELFVELKFTVSDNPATSITVSPPSKVFTAARPGYSNSGMAQVFTIENVGTERITGLTASLSGTDFEISSGLSAASINTGGKITISVRPKAGLPARATAYTDTLTITGSNGLSADIPLSFTVSTSDINAANYGDVNGDGVIDRDDLILLLKYFSQPGVSIDLAAADANGDGVVNTADLTLMLRYFTHSGIVLGPRG